MDSEQYWNDINKEAHERRRRWRHIANYPARLIEQLIKDETLTVEERNELIQFEMRQRNKDGH